MIQPEALRKDLGGDDFPVAITLRFRSEAAKEVR